jgi:hypothetical protein
MYTDETVLVLDNPTLLKTLWRSFYIANYPNVKRSIKILFHSGIVTLTSPSKFLTGTIFLHAHLQAVYYNCVKFHLYMYLVSATPPKQLIGFLFFMKLYTVVILYLQMCMKEYGCCPKFGRGDNLTRPYFFMHICRYCTTTV